MRRFDKTSMGGKKITFQTTDWTDIQHAKTQNEIQRRIIIDKIIKRYWKPVYCYIRRKGHTNETAKDLTQDFFYEIFLGRQLVQKADLSKGRFRPFLLTALDRYLIDKNKYETANKRHPNGQLFTLEDIDFTEISISASDMTPEQDFHHAYVLDLLNYVLSEVKDECYNIGRRIHWEVFRERLLVPIFDDVAPPPLSDICKKYDIKNSTIASNMIITVKRRLRKALERRLRQSVPTDSDIEGELSDLLKIFPKIAQD